jgi:glycosyltransferase involved in cell wall biosynthesis
MPSIRVEHEKPVILIAHSGRQHSHQAALALQQAGVLGCYATGVPVSRNQLGAPWAGILRRFSVYEEVDIPRRQTRIYLLAPAVNRLLARYLPERIIKPTQYETYRMFDRWVARLVLEHHFDAVIAYENSALHTFRAAKKTGAKCILDAADLHHADQDRYHTSTLSSAYKMRVDMSKDAEIALADCIFVTSDMALKSYLTNVGSKKMIRAIPLGVDIDQFKPNPEVRSSKSFPPRFIFVGSANAKKGFDVILESMDMLFSEGFSFKLLVVGVTDQSLIAKRKHLRDNIVEFGMVGHSRLPSILTTSDCLLLPSRFESFGLVVAEAMACGVPVIVSDMVGAKELVDEGRNGFIVPVGCREALADRMRWCMVHREKLKTMSTAARATAEKASWAGYRERFMAAVRETMATREW